MPDAAAQPQLPATPKGRGTRERLKLAATQLFAARSYAEVRITDITAAADLSPGAFYRYFDDRRALMLELLREMTAEVFDFARTPMDVQSPITSVLETTRRYFEFYESHRALFGLMIELSQSDREVAEIWAGTQRDFYSRIARALRRGVGSGRFRSDIDPELAAEMLGSMTEFYA
ncbi:MAG: TetR/AcrR family transcriptional regulator, partial [Leucobacter sp.]|nr:TetR/AcrR family transcriptional regulator [Leucobacter sp.]